MDDPLLRRRSGIQYARGDQAAGHPNGTIAATIDGSPWLATVMVQTSRATGLLAIAGVDAEGRTISIGLAASAPGSAQRIGSASAANAILMIGTRCWTANDAGGDGHVTLSRLESGRAAGRFAFRAVAMPNDAEPGVRAITNGIFDVHIDEDGD